MVWIDDELEEPLRAAFGNSTRSAPARRPTCGGGQECLGGRADSRGGRNPASPIARPPFHATYVSYLGCHICEVTNSDTLAGRATFASFILNATSATSAAMWADTSRIRVSAG